MFSGVISSNSSVSINSNACSKLKIFGGDNFNASSDPEARVFVSFLLRHTLISISSVFPVCPMTIPPYTFSPGPTNNVPLSCALNRPYVIVSPASYAINDPCLRYWISPLYGPYPSNSVFKIPFPFVSVMNSPRYPISPLDGIENSSLEYPPLAAVIF